MLTRPREIGSREANLARAGSSARSTRDTASESRCSGAPTSTDRCSDAGTRFVGAEWWCGPGERVAGFDSGVSAVDCGCEWTATSIRPSRVLMSRSIDNIVSGWAAGGCGGGAANGGGGQYVGACIAGGACIGDDGNGPVG